jgi:hypothetical protein
MHPLTIQLLNEKMGLKGAEAKKGLTTESNIPPGESLKMSRQKKEEIASKIQSRKNKMTLQ